MILSGGGTASTTRVRTETVHCGIWTFYCGRWAGTCRKRADAFGRCQKMAVRCTTIAFSAGGRRSCVSLEQQDILRDIRQETKQPKEEPVAQAAQELQKLSTCSLRSAEWSECDGLLYYHGCIYVPDTSDLHRRIVSLCHDTKVAGHPGCFKTLELVS